MFEGFNNSDTDWKLRNYLHEWVDIASRFDIATGYFEIGALLSLDGQWQQLEKIRILMGDEVSRRIKNTIMEGLEYFRKILDNNPLISQTQNSVFKQSSACRFKLMQAVFLKEERDS